MRKIPPSGDRPISADDATLFSTVRDLWPYIWPSDRPDLKLRVALAMLALVVAKIVTVLVPYFFKWATDALTQEGEGADQTVFYLSLPVILVIAYGVGRIMLAGFNQLRDALFAEVSQFAVRSLAYRTFVHMHALSLRFHLARRTGGLSRVIERGVKGIDAIVRFTILNAAPTVLEFALSAGIIFFHFGLSYLIVIAATVVLYVWFS
ncbi:MAG TPA: ABC transporter transmembrane domain-containing protein, partial [Methylomirabilota bacterium]|nr:ABC transporter transmembrane domain-containing protein [Methylomirabilota bacterium]